MLTRLFCFRQWYCMFRNILWSQAKYKWAQHQNLTLSFQSLKTNVFIFLDMRWKSIQNNIRLTLAAYCIPHLRTATTTDEVISSDITILKLNLVICLSSCRHAFRKHTCGCHLTASSISPSLPSRSPPPHSSATPTQKASHWSSVFRRESQHLLHEQAELQELKTPA